jgi:hypothetical protein
MSTDPLWDSLGSITLDIDGGAPLVVQVVGPELTRRGLVFGAGATTVAVPAGVTALHVARGHARVETRGVVVPAGGEVVERIAARPGTPVPPLAGWWFDVLHTAREDTAPRPLGVRLGPTVRGADGSLSAEVHVRVRDPLAPATRWLLVNGRGDRGMAAMVPLPPGQAQARLALRVDHSGLTASLLPHGPAAATVVALDAGWTVPHEDVWPRHDAASRLLDTLVRVRRADGDDGDDPLARRGSPRRGRSLDLFPDYAILGAHLAWQRGDVKRARGAFGEALWGGIPYFGISLAMLVEGLRLIPDPERHQRRIRALTELFSLVEPSSTVVTARGDAARLRRLHGELAPAGHRVTDARRLRGPATLAALLGVAGLAASPMVRPRGAAAGVITRVVQTLPLRPRLGRGRRARSGSQDAIPDAGLGETFEDLARGWPDLDPVADVIELPRFDTRPRTRAAASRWAPVHGTWFGDDEGIEVRWTIVEQHAVSVEIQRRMGLADAGWRDPPLVAAEVTTERGTDIYLVPLDVGPERVVGRVTLPFTGAWIDLRLMRPYLDHGALAQVGRAVVVRSVLAATAMGLELWRELRLQLAGDPVARVHVDQGLDERDRTYGD